MLQDFIIFPAASSGLWSKKGPVKNRNLPDGVKPLWLKTSDGKTLEAWSYGEKTRKAGNRVAIIFHGNGGNLENFFPYQEWLAGIGLKSYSFDYRGYGLSNGWPSESGIYIDAETVWNEVIKQEATSPEQIILVAISIGSGPAAYLAQEKQAGAAIFFTAYTSLPEIAAKSILFRPFGWLLRYDFPVKEYLENYKGCLILTHAEDDEVIPYSHFQDLKKINSSKLYPLSFPKGGHNSLFWHAKDKIAETLHGKCSI